MPDWKPSIRERLADLSVDGAWQAEVTEELEQHLEDRYREACRSGMTEDQARDAALAELQEGGALRDELRKIARPAPLTVPERGGARHAVIPDLRFGLRSLRTRPGFSLLVMGMLALGIAGNTAIFSIFNGLFLNPLPFADSDRLVDLDETAPKWNLTFVGVSNSDFDAWRRSNQSFEGMAFFTQSAYNLSGIGQAQRVRGAQVTRDLLDVLRLAPALGRNFTEAEDRPKGPKAVLLGYALWQRLFHGDPAILGRVLQLNQEPYTVVGVLPRAAVFPDDVEMWVALAADPKDAGSWYLNGVGRLKRGVTPAQASADLTRLHKSLIKQAPVNEITSPTVMPLRDRYLGDFRPVSRVLIAGVAVVLLIACVNIAALMMVRGAARSREFAIRTAIGASRGRIIQQLLTETAVLASIGGAVGIGLGALLLRGMLSLLPEGIPKWISFPMDWRFIGFAFGITFLSAILFGLLPAIQSSRMDAQGSLIDATPKSSLSPGRRRALSSLVIGEIALALMMLTAAGLLLAAFRRVTTVDPGFRPENVLVFSVDLPEVKYPKPEQKVAFFDRLLEKLRAAPGVQSAGAVSAPPLGGHNGYFFEAEGVPPSEKGNPVVLGVVASPGYIPAIGMPMLEGRAFEPQDGASKGAPEVIVNETFARRNWPGASGLGKHIRFAGATNLPWFSVIGVMKDEKHYGLDQEMRPAVYMPMRMQPRGSMALVLRTAIDPTAITASAREILREMDSDLPMYAVHTMQEQVDRSLWVRRAYSWLFGAFAGVALLLAAAGIYGVISYAVTQRTKEIGIRIALGAQRGQVMAQVLRSGMVLVALGVVIGLAGALGGARLLDSLLFGVSWHDTAIYGSVIAGVVLVGLLANLAPARRAASVDPIYALRFE